MSRWLATTIGIVVIAGLIVGPAVYASRQQHRMRNFRVVRPGVLYRSGQMPTDALQRVLHDYNIRTVVNLRDGTTSLDQKEEDYCRKAGVQFVRIPPRPWSGDSDTVPAEESVKAFRAVMSNPRNHPVLVHCYAGVHRTGTHVAVYRMEFEGWTNQQALDEVRACGYTNLDNELDVFGYLKGYQASGKAR